MNTKTKTIVALMIVLSMLMVSSAETGTLEMEEAFDCDIVVINVNTINYNATVEDYYTGKRYVGDYNINGTADFGDKVYEADLNATGGIWIREDQVTHLDLQLIGKIYQNSELGYLYKEEDKDYYGYIETGYNITGKMLYDKSTIMPDPNYLISDFSFDPYSKYVVTKVISPEVPQAEDIEFTSSSSALGLVHGSNGMGDVIPTLFAYKDPDTGKRVVSETYPTDHTGLVIRTPARIIGEPLFPNDFWTTPKGIKILEKKANKAK